MTEAGQLSTFVDKTVVVITNDGRTIVGVLLSFDQASNVGILHCHERVFSLRAGVEQVVLGGVHVIRGDNIAIIGEVDMEMDSRLDFASIRAAPLRPVAH